MEQDVQNFIDKVNSSDGTLHIYSDALHWLECQVLKAELQNEVVKLTGFWIRKRDNFKLNDTETTFYLLTDQLNRWRFVDKV